MRIQTNLKIICYLLEMNVKKMIRPNCHPTYNERNQKIIELIDLTLEKYKANKENTQIDNIIQRT
jgi:hypothetical protein